MKDFQIVRSYREDQNNDFSILLFLIALKFGYLDILNLARIIF